MSAQCSLIGKECSPRRPPYHKLTSRPPNQSELLHLKHSLLNSLILQLNIHHQNQLQLLPKKWLHKASHSLRPVERDEQKRQKIVTCNKPTRTEKSVESGCVPLQNNYRNYHQSRLWLMNQLIRYPMASFTLHGELLEGTKSLLNNEILPQHQWKNFPMQ